jgi:hypothetical protein
LDVAQDNYARAAVSTGATDKGETLRGVRILIPTTTAATACGRTTTRTLNRARSAAATAARPTYARGATHVDAATATTGEVHIRT